MTRMGLHCNSGRGLGRAADFARDTQPAAMKFLVLNRAVLERIRRESPGTKIVYRHYWGDQIIGDSGQRQRFTNAVLNVVREYHGLIDYFEGWNEAVATSTTPSILRQFCGEELDFARRVNDAGGGAAIGGFSTGAWDFEQDGSKMFTAALSMLSYLHDTGDRNALHFHEYGGTYMAWGVRTPDGLNQWDWNGNRPTALGGAHLYDPGLDGWWCLRYRMARRRLVSAGLTGVRFLITEAGLDDVSPRPGGHGKGWRDWTADEWTNIQGDYAAQWQWYMWHISHDPYVIGAVDFGFGTEDPTWNSFDLYQTPAMLERMASHQVALPVGHIGVKPEEPMDNRLHDMLRAEFGDAYNDLRAVLAQNPNGPNGAFGKLAPAAVTAMVLHHTAGSYDTTWHTIADYHVDTRKFAGIGYHLGIQRGRVSYLGDIGTARAHVAGLNDKYVGVVVAGNYEQETPRAADLAILKRLGGVLRSYFGRDIPWKGHRDLAQTACPGANLYAVLPGLDGGQSSDIEAIKAAARAEHLAHGIRYNPDAALARTIHERGEILSTNEFEAGGVVCQVGEQWGGASKAVYVWRGGRVERYAL